jgi:hypothetical protein
MEAINNVEQDYISLGQDTEEGSESSGENQNTSVIARYNKYTTSVSITHNSCEFSDEKSSSNLRQSAI